MKAKTMVILLLVLAIMIGASFVVFKMQSPKQSAQAKLGEKLLKDLPVNEIADITMQHSEHTVSLGKQDDKWVVQSRFNYAADFKKIIDFVKKWKDAKTGRNFSASDSTISRLGMKKPDDKKASDKEKGVHIVLADNNGKNIADILLGKTRENESGASGGQYVMINNEPIIYLIDKSFGFMEKESSGWLDKELVDVKTEDVEKVVCIKPDGSILYTLKRPEKDKKPEMLNPPEGKKIKTYELDNIFQALSNFRLEDIIDPAQKTEEKKGAYSLEFSLFNGTVYKVHPQEITSGDEKKYTFKIQVAYKAPQPDPEKKTEESVAANYTKDKAKKLDKDKKEEKPEKSPKEFALEAENLNKKLSAWTYVISKWKYENFITNLDEFFEQEEKKED
ncbi:DUF4340 domain-containing protein [Candidatus Magnetomoraceae bacterium gMMP-1]